MSSDEWMSEAECRGEDPDLFEDPLGSPGAVALCGACEVRERCLDHLLSWPVQAGYGAGLPESKRSRLARRMGRPK